MKLTKNKRNRQKELKKLTSKCKNIMKKIEEQMRLFLRKKNKTQEVRKYNLKIINKLTLNNKKRKK